MPSIILLGLDRPLVSYYPVWGGWGGGGGGGSVILRDEERDKMRKERSPPPNFPRLEDKTKREVQPWGLFSLSPPSLQLVLNLTFMEAVRGCSKEIPLRVQATCDRCIGSGGEPGTKEQVCPLCRGRGEVSCVCVCVCVCVCACMHACMHSLCVCVMHVCVCVHACVHVCMCMHVCMCVCAACMCVCVCVCMHACVYVCVCMYVCTCMRVVFLSYLPVVILH